MYRELCVFSSEFAGLHFFFFFANSIFVYPLCLLCLMCPIGVNLLATIFVFFE